MKLRVALIPVIIGAALGIVAGALPFSAGATLPGPAAYYGTAWYHNG
jgi:hypothetical protein